jgi:hypothetical protein
VGTRRTLLTVETIAHPAKSAFLTAPSVIYGLSTRMIPMTALKILSLISLVARVRTSAAFPALIKLIISSIVRSVFVGIAVEVVDKDEVQVESEGDRGRKSRNWG